LPDAPVSLADVEAVTNKDQIGLTWSEGASNVGTVVIDYKMWYAEQGEVFTVLAENIVPTDYTALALTTGVWYQFKVQARNAEGHGPLSNVVTILAAQEPDQPAAPTTVWTRDFVTIVWTEPTINGAEILSYNIQIRQKDDTTFSNALSHCDGS